MSDEPQDGQFGDVALVTDGADAPAADTAPVDVENKDGGDGESTLSDSESQQNDESVSEDQPEAESDSKDDSEDKDEPKKPRRRKKKAEASEEEPEVVEPEVVEVYVLDHSQVIRIVRFAKLFDSATEDFRNAALAVFRVKTDEDHAARAAEAISNNPERYQPLPYLFSIIEKRHDNTESRRDGVAQFSFVQNLSPEETRGFSDTLKVLHEHFASADDPKDAKVRAITQNTETETALNVLDEVIDERTDREKVYHFAMWMRDLLGHYAG